MGSEAKLLGDASPRGEWRPFGAMSMMPSAIENGRSAVAATYAEGPTDMLHEASALRPEELSAVRWRYTTGTFQALGYSFAVRSTHEGIGRFVGEMYGPCIAPHARPTTWYSIVDGLPGEWPHALYVGSDRASQGVHATQVLNYLTWHVNQQVVARSGDLVLLHAAAAALDDVGVILPAAMESGKTTLVAGLVKAGFRYLTDEAAAIHPESLRLHPYPKPLSIDPGSWSVLGDLEPHVDASTAAYLEEQWQVTPQRIRPNAISGPVDAALVVFPRYEQGVETVLEPLRRSEAMLVMLEQTFSFHVAGRRNLLALARFLDGVNCYRLVTGDLDEACGALLRLAEAVRSDRER